MNHQIPKRDIPGMLLESMQITRYKAYYEFLNTLTNEVKLYLEDCSFSRARGYLDCAYTYMHLDTNDYQKLMELCDKAEAEFYVGRED